MSRRKETKNDAERILKKVLHELKCQRVKEKADVLMTHLEKGRRINMHSFLTTKETINNLGNISTLHCKGKPHRLHFQQTNTHNER